MRRLWDFHGGITPPENKALSLAEPIRPAPLPERLVLPLVQHAGPAPEPVVAPGDRVLGGQLLARGDQPRSLPVHAPTSGEILAIGDHPVPHPSGLDDRCIILAVDGEDRQATASSVDIVQCDAQTLLRTLHDAGIAGLGGAGFPTDTKLAPPGERPIHTLILNGAECEPYITADQALMREQPERILQGGGIMARILAATGHRGSAPAAPVRILLAVEDNKPEAIRALRAAAEKEAVKGTAVELVVIPTRYPSGGERQLIRILTGEEVPSGGLPADLGIVCQNVGTAAAVADAVLEGRPLTHRIITLTGTGLQRPGNFRVALGTPLRTLLEASGWDPASCSRLILGGPLMGFTLHNPDAPVIKTSNCLIAATEAEMPPPPAPDPCIRCGECEKVCPSQLLPQQLLWHSQGQEWDKAEALGLFDCIDCGACAYVCPSHIPLVQYYRHAKGEIRQQQADQARADRARRRFEERQQRLEREKAEKEARRRARAEALARKRAGQAPADEAPARPEKSKAARAEAVRAALARSQSHKRPTAAGLEQLEQNVDRARERLCRAEEALAQTPAEETERRRKLEASIQGHRQRLNAAREALEAAQSQGQETTP